MRPRVNTLLAVLVLALVWLIGSDVRAQQVLVLSTHVEAAEVGEEELRVRVRNELAARGFTVETADAGPDDPDAIEPWLKQLATDGHAALAVSVRLVGDRASLVVVDRATAKSLRREVSIAPPVASTVALATAELVEASLLEVMVEHETVEPEVELDTTQLSFPTLPAPTRTIQPARRWRLGSGLGIRWPTSMPSPVATADVHAMVVLARRVGLGLTATLPLHRHRSQTVGVEVRTWPVSYGVLATVDLLPDRAPIDLELLVGAETVATHTRTRFEGETSRETLWTGLLGGGLGIRKDFRCWYLGARLRADAPLVALRLRTLGVLAQDHGGLWVRASVVAGVRL